jgi:hypothetical protein
MGPAAHTPLTVLTVIANGRKTNPEMQISSAGKLFVGGVLTGQIHISKRDFSSVYKGAGKSLKVNGIFRPRGMAGGLMYNEVRNTPSRNITNSERLSGPFGDRTSCW